MLRVFWQECIYLLFRITFLCIELLILLFYVCTLLMNHTLLHLIEIHPHCISISYDFVVQIRYYYDVIS